MLYLRGMNQQLDAKEHVVEMRTNNFCPWSGRMLAACLLAAVSLNAAEPSVTRLFRPVRDARGDENIRRCQDIDDAAWIWYPNHVVWGVSSDCNAWNVRFSMKSAPFDFFRLRNRFRSDGSPLEFDISADERFTLYLDGRRIAEGPHRGLVEHWYYQSYRIEGLPPGEHLLEAVVWQLGIHAPLAQLSYRGGFILKAAGSYDGGLTTGKGAWEIAPLQNTKMTNRGTSRTFGAGSQCRVTGTGFPNEQPPADAWRKAEIVRDPIKPNKYGGRTKGWMLFPSDRPDQTYDLKTPGRVVNMKRDLTRPFTVPAGTELDLWWDLDDYYCAYPVLETSGGLGAEVTWGWTETLRDADGKKGSRDAWKDMFFVQTFTDTFVADGRDDAQFTAPWWRCGRWCRLKVKTTDAPLVIRRVAIAESRYPIVVDSSFACDDPSFEPISKISRRAMEMCTHEMLFDCPYYEQQMYPGDTRIQLNVLNALTRDARMTRFAMSVYDFDRRDNGMIAMNFPTRGTQESATYSFCWAMMFRDYLMWHDDAAFLRVRMPGVRNMLMGAALYENADGLLENLPGWSFMDWVAGDQPFTGGVAPCGSPGEGVSSLNNLQYLLAMQSAAAVDEALGEKLLAAHWRAKVDRLGRAIVAAFWDNARGALSDTVRKDRFSEHAQCLAILAGILSPSQRDSSFAALVKGEGLAPTSSYFAHYLFETYAACGRPDLIRARFSYWRNFIEWGARTTFETQNITSRSDCHAWSACPIYFMHTVFAGVSPATPFFRTVRIAPQPAGLKSVKANTPCPQGIIETDLRFEGDAVRGTVTLPKDLAGVFEWRGKTLQLSPGRQEMKMD